MGESSGNKEKNREMIKDFLFKNYYSIIQTILGILLIFLLVKTFQPIPDNSELIKFKLDTLNKEIESLHLQQRSIDSCIRNTNENIKKIDNQIDSIKVEKKTINNIYNTNSTKIRNFDAKQTDSLLRLRYRY
jgi:septal ring factor EnvC (AmiA/AmiB activator)